MRATFAEEQGRILFVGIELGRIDDPCQHLLAVRGLHPAAFYAAHVELVIDVLVFGGELRGLCEGIAFARLVYGIDFVGHAHGVAGGHQLVTTEGDGAVVVHAFGELYHLFGLVEGDVVDLFFAVPYAQKVDAF